jgi:hypothetical protein
MALPIFKKDPGPILAILENLKDDPSESVRRSVANNLNDISKDNPHVTLQVCERWIGRSDRTDWIVKHACRTLLKRGDGRALSLFGYSDPALLRITSLEISDNRPNIGDTVQFSFVLEVEGKRESRVRLEYAVHFIKARGKASKKVFKIMEGNYAPGSHRFSRKLSFVDLSTRKHYPGEHRITIIANGEEKAEICLSLLPA